MGKFEITTPDGKKFEIEAADAQAANATLEEFMAQGQGGQAQPQQQQPTAQAPQDSGWQEPGAIVPIQFPKGPGMPRLAMPSIITDTLNAIQAPGNAMRGKYDELPIDPATGQPTPFDPRMMDDAMSLAGVITPGSVVARSAKPAAIAAQGAVREADSFGIPLTRGQTTGNLRKLTKEERMRQFDGPAQPIMRRFDQKQQDSIGTAINDIGGRLGDPANMAERVTGSLRDKVAFSKERAGGLYDIAFDSDLSVKPEAIGALPDVVARHLDESAQIVDPQITPEAAFALNEIKKASQLSGGLDPMGKGAPANPVAVSLRGLEQVRRRIINLKGSTDTDRAALRVIKGAFDDWVDESVDKALFSGDEAALSVLKEARGEASFYKGITNPKPGDSVGRRMNKMRDEETTAGEVANWLYGADIVSPNLDAPKLAGRLKMTLGPQSPEFTAIRAQAWERLTKDLATGDPRTAQVIARRIEQFANAKGSSLATVLFDQSQLDRMRAFASVLKRTVTPRDATNPSRTAFMLGPMMNGVMNSIMGGIGLATFGPGGLAAAAAIPVLKNAKTMAGAAKAVRPLPKAGGAFPVAPKALGTMTDQNFGPKLINLPAGKFRIRMDA